MNKMETMKAKMILTKEMESVGECLAMIALHTDKRSRRRALASEYLTLKNVRDNIGKDIK